MLVVPKHVGVCSKGRYHLPLAIFSSAAHLLFNNLIALFPQTLYESSVYLYEACTDHVPVELFFKGEYDLEVHSINCICVFLKRRDKM